MTAKAPHKLLPATLRSLIVVLICAVSMGIFHRLHLLHQIEMIGIEPFLRSVPSKADRVVVVEVTDQDYERFFGSTSPLNRTQLATLIENVASVKPRIIVVDFDVSTTPRALSPALPGCGPNQPKPTKGSSPSFEEEVTACVDSISPKTRVIWAQMYRVVKLNGEPVPQLGAISERVHLALPLFPQDVDGAVRRYERWIPVVTQHGSHREWWPTIPYAAHDEGAEPQEAGQGEGEYYFPFSASQSLDRIDANAFLICDPKLTPCTPSTSEDVANRSAFMQDKKVIIGGTFHAARDEYFTPAGPLPGVILNALALQAEDDETLIKEANEIAVFMIDVWIGALIVAFGTWVVKNDELSSTAQRLTFILLLAGILTVPVLLSSNLLASTKILVNAIPIIIGAFGHIIIDNLWEIPGMQREVAKLDAENTVLTKENEELRAKVEVLTRASRPDINVINIVKT